MRVSDLGRCVPQQHLEGIGALERLSARRLLRVIGGWGTFSRLAAGGLPLCSLGCFVPCCLLQRLLLFLVFLFLLFFFLLFFLLFSFLCLYLRQSHMSHPWLPRKEWQAVYSLVYSSIHSFIHSFIFFLLFLLFVFFLWLCSFLCVHKKAW